MPEEYKEKRFSKDHFLVFFSFALLGALVGLTDLLTIPSDPKNSFLFGYSASRLVLIAFFVAAIIGAGIFTLKSWRDQRWMRRIDELFFTGGKIAHWALGVSSAVFLVFGLLSLLPIYRFGHFAAYAERLRPIILFFTQISFQTAILILHRAGHLSWQSFAQELRAQGLTLWIAVGCMVIFGALWGIVARTGIGIHPTAQTNWYESGVPVLAIQVLMTALIAVALTGLIGWLSRKKEPRGLDIFISIAIWALAAFLWSQAPLPPNNFFAPGPYPPDYAYLPYSDAASFDMSAQYALAGQGIAGGNTFKGHNAYLGFLAFLHLLAGQDYSLLIMWQVAIFAVFPVLVYFVGKAMCGRFLGLFMAGLVIMQELNAIASGSRLNLSHSKLLMTEFPTKIGLAALILLLLLWLRKPDRNFALALPAGSVLGILMLLRYNTLTLPFAVIAGAWLIYGKNWRMWFKTAMMLFAALTITISPWMWRSWQRSGDPLFFAPKVIYRIQAEFQDATAMPPVDDAVSGIELDDELPAPSPELENAAPRQSVETATDALPSPDSPSPAKINRNGSLYQISSHFVHNLITNALILPTRPIFDMLPDSISDGSLYEVVPFWKNLYDDWLTDLPPVDLAGIVINLLLLSLGIGTAFRKWKWAGLIPLGVLLTYHFSTALVRDAGGRYIVPVDWIVLLYFALGLLKISQWCLTWLGLSKNPYKSVTSVSKNLSLRTAILLTLPFFMYTLSMTVLDQAMPQRYAYLSKVEVLERLIQAGGLDQTSFDAASLKEFLNHPEARAVYGLSLYPRFFGQNQGLHRGIYLDHPFPRLAFTMITAFGPEYLLLPLDTSPPSFPHGTDVIVIGCQSIDRRGLWHIDALLVASLAEPEPHTLLTRIPAALTCPLEHD